MRKAFILIILLAIVVVSCRPSGKAIDLVPGDAGTQAVIYLDKSEEALNTGDWETSAAYLVHAESAISKIPYQYKSIRENLKTRYDQLNERTDFVRTQLQEI